MITDFKQTIDGDIDITSGRIEMAEPTGQHKHDILMASVGDFKQSPLTGVGIMEHINSEDSIMLPRDVSIAMQRDGIKIKRVGFDSMGNLIIDGEYEQ